MLYTKSTQSILIKLFVHIYGHRLKNKFINVHVFQYKTNTILSHFLFKSKLNRLSGKSPNHETAKKKQSFLLTKQICKNR